MFQLPSESLIAACFLLVLIAPCQPCPTNRTLNNLCKCEDSFSGVILICDGAGKNFDPLQIFKILSDNKLQLGIIQQLSVQNTSLKILPGRLFDGLYVKKLDLSNNLLENVSSTAFDGLENVLQILILANNSLSDVPFEALSKNNLQSLIQLDLSGNKIRDLDSDDQEFTGLPRLTDLNLSNNKICKMKRDLFTNVKDTLLTLNLGNNCLDEVPASALRGFRQLLALHVHNNLIEELGPLQFMNMPTLNLINLAKNRIKSIHPRIEYLLPLIS
uniref:Uncharacterized protein n=1 Tax=Romanomermis culicivorax TaxID=13658 RepID=A0A915KCS3_ROMCU